MGLLSKFSKYCPFGCFLCYVPKSKRSDLPILERVDLETNPSSVASVISLNVASCEGRTSKGGDADFLSQEGWPPQVPTTPVRLVLISDTHGRHAELDVPDGDVLIHAGDFCRSWRRADRAEVRAFDAWLGTLPHRHKFVVPGNHDGLPGSGDGGLRETNRPAEAARREEEILLYSEGAGEGEEGASTKGRERVVPGTTLFVNASICSGAKTWDLNKPIVVDLILD